MNGIGKTCVHEARLQKLLKDIKEFCYVNSPDRLPEQTRTLTETEIDALLSSDVSQWR